MHRVGVDSLYYTVSRLVSTDGQLQSLFRIHRHLRVSCEQKFRAFHAEIYHLFYILAFYPTLLGLEFIRFQHT